MSARNVAWTYAFIIISLTAVYVYSCRECSFTKLALTMFLPSTVALIFNVTDIVSFVENLLVGTERQQSFKKNSSIIIMATLLAVVINMLITLLCAVWSLLVGWGSIATSSNLLNSDSIHVHSKSVLIGFVRAAGEEIGWRCYLLPLLMSAYRPTTALGISGLVWGLFHVPVMILLVQRLQIDDDVVTVLVQCIAVAMYAFPIGWITIRSGYSMWPATVMHFTMNVINPMVFGSIYTQKEGFIVGKQWLINGEGLTGIIIGIPVAILVSLDLLRTNQNITRKLGS